MKKDIIEIDFTSQIQASNDCDCGACDEEECGCPCHVANAKLDESIAFSVKVMETLAVKCEEHNKDRGNAPVNLQELKRAYRMGASCSPFEDQSLGELAMARVNLLLRIKSREFKDIISEQLKEEKELSGLIFDYGEDSVLNDRELDMFASWSPQEKDFDKAKKDIEKYDLNYDYKNIDELYLDEYEGIPHNYE